MRASNLEARVGLARGAVLAMQVPHAAKQIGTQQQRIEKLPRGVQGGRVKVDRDRRHSGRLHLGAQGQSLATHPGPQHLASDDSVLRNLLYETRESLDVVLHRISLSN